MTCENFSYNLQIYETITLKRITHSRLFDPEWVNETQRRNNLTLCSGVDMTKIILFLQ
jgi:hypothetical protein